MTHSCFDSNDRWVWPRKKRQSPDYDAFPDCGYQWATNSPLFQSFQVPKNTFKVKNLHEPTAWNHNYHAISFNAAYNVIIVSLVDLYAIWMSFQKVLVLVSRVRFSQLFRARFPLVQWSFQVVLFMNRDVWWQDVVHDHYADIGLVVNHWC